MWECEAQFPPPSENISFPLPIDKCLDTHRYRKTKFLGVLGVCTWFHIPGSVHVSGSHIIRTASARETDSNS